VAVALQPVPLGAPMAIPSPVLVPPPLVTAEEMVLTDGDVLGEALIKTGDLADPGSLALESLASVVNLSAAESFIDEGDGLKGTEDLQPSGLHSGLHSELHSAEALQKAAVDALTGARSQDTAADALSDAEWTVVDGEVRVQTELSKTMLPMVVNAEAEKLIKAALQKAGGGTLKLLLLPGVKVAAAPKKPRAAKSGSAQAMAMEHPIVQRAQTLFNAEIQSVIDLRDND
jgi:DNA polymerase III subunit gamma/tau